MCNVCRSLFVLLSFCPFSVGHCVVCPSIYGLWLHLWYLHTLLSSCIFVWNKHYNIVRLRNKTLILIYVLNIYRTFDNDSGRNYVLFLTLFISDFNDMWVWTWQVYLLIRTNRICGVMVNSVFTLSIAVDRGFESRSGSNQTLWYFCTVDRGFESRCGLNQTLWYFCLLILR